MNRRLLINSSFNKIANAGTKHALQIFKLNFRVKILSKDILFSNANVKSLLTNYIKNIIIET